MIRKKTIEELMDDSIDPRTIPGNVGESEHQLRARIHRLLRRYLSDCCARNRQELDLALDDWELR